MATMISQQDEQLLEQVVSTGRFKDQEEALSAALRLLREQTSNGSFEPSILPPDRWVEEFDRITASRRGGNPHMDDSRESIYGDRGL
jgi:Arc/MetJ-type ribon-helix-helix transcriptional regulator